MKIASTTLTALGLLVSFSGAFAQTSEGTSTGLLNDKAFMRPFYTDDNMTTMADRERMRAAWANVTPEQREQLMSECQNATSPRDTDCQEFKAVNDLN